MDTSEQYIKMCEKAVEIHGRYYQPGDLISDHGVVCIFPWQFLYIGDLANLIWLPRQDQLQEMLDFTKTGISNCVFRYTLSALQNFANQQNDKFYSWEQLWLAFVLYEKYHKKWDGESWIQE